MSNNNDNLERYNIRAAPPPSPPLSSLKKKINLKKVKNSIKMMIFFLKWEKGKSQWIFLPKINSLLKLKK